MEKRNTVKEKTPDKQQVSGLARWGRFVVGVILLAFFAGFFMSGYTPPGIFGEVLRHNQAEGIDASPLLYSEVAHMAALERGVRLMREAARRHRTGGLR